MRQISLRQNTFLEEMTIVPINGILQKDELQVMNSFKQSTTLLQWDQQEYLQKINGY